MTFNRKLHLVGTRPDYLTARLFMLDNPDWPILPSIQMIQEHGPMILVCQDHEDGWNKHYVHAPVNPIHSNLPSIDSPVLAHAVLCPRTIRSIKVNKFSNTYQLVGSEGHYAGIDCCYIQEHGHFDSTMSRISKNDEILFYPTVKI
jgi:hypothetical protein